MAVVTESVHGNESESGPLGAEDNDKDLEEVGDEEGRHRGDERRAGDDQAGRDDVAADQRDADADERAKSEREDDGSEEQREGAERRIDKEIGERRAVQVDDAEAATGGQSRSTPRADGVAGAGKAWMRDVAREVRHQQRKREPERDSDRDDGERDAE